MDDRWKLENRLPEEEMIDISSPSTDSWRTSFRVFINILTCRRIVPSAYTLIHLALSHTHPLNSPLIKCCWSVYARHDLPFRYLLALLITFLKFFCAIKVGEHVTFKNAKWEVVMADDFWDFSYWILTSILEGKTVYLPYLCPVLDCNMLY